MEIGQANAGSIQDHVFEEKKEKQFKRRRFLVSPSVQVTYIALSVIPAIIATLFCTYVLIYSGETVLRANREAPLVPIYNMRQTVENLEKVRHAGGTASEVNELKAELDTLKLFLEDGYRETLSRWNTVRLQIFCVMFWCVILIACLALVFSHRVAGPLYRLQKCIDQFVLGQDTGPIHLRKKDHYKQLASSIENLRKRLLKKGVLQKIKDM